MTLLNILAGAARRHPRKGFHFIQSGREVKESMSYRELDARARSVAVSLMEQGVPTGARVCLSLGPGLEFLTAFWGCVYAGVIPVPAPPVFETLKSRAIEHLQRILKDCEPTLLVNDAVLGMLSGDPRAYRTPAIDRYSTAFLQYTSGSTRRPRGVVVTHPNALENLKMLQSFAGPAGQGVMVHWLPLHHDMGLVRGMLCPIAMGAECYLMDPMEFVQRPQHWLQALSHFQATITGAPNFGFRMATRKGNPDGLDLSALKVAFCSAEPIRPETVEAFLTRYEACGLAREAFKPSYGLAEATVAVCGELRESYHTRPSPAQPEKTLICCGQPLGDIKLVIVDEESRTCPPDMIGEVWLRGPSVTSGYWNRGQGDDRFKSFLETGEGPFFRTGDLGFLDPDGSLYVTGRKDDLMIIRGQNYQPHDLEATLEEELPALRPGCTVVYQTGERIGVTCETRTGKFEQLAREARRVIGEEFGLAVVDFTVLPLGSSFKTSSGKLQRSLTREQVSEQKVTPLFQWRRPSE